MGTLNTTAQFIVSKLMLSYPLLNVFWPLLRTTSLAKGEDDLFMRLNLQKGAVVLEAGARTGALTLALAKQVGATGKVIAVEPNPYSFRLLSKIIGHFDNVLKVNAALGEKAGNATIVIKKPFDNGAHIGRPNSPSERSIPIKVTTVDSLLQTLKINHVDYMIVDCEGAELAVLKGARNALEERRILNLIIEIHQNKLKQEVEDFLSERNYKCEIFSVQLDQYPLMHASLSF